MDDDDSKNLKKHLQSDSPSNSRSATKGMKPFQPDHDESDPIVTEERIPSIISNTSCTTLVDGDCGSDVTTVVVDDDMLPMVPFELWHHKIFPHVGDYRYARLVCRRWKNLVDDGIASGVLLSREEMALIELKPLGVSSLDITRLDCFGMGIESIPDSVGALTNLKWLDLSMNALVSIPVSIGSLTNLTTLWLYNNQLAVIPDTIGGLTSLTILRLHGNQLSIIPDTIGSLTKLTELHLYENQLTSIPDSLGSLTNLTILNLSNQKSGVKLSRPPLPSSCEVWL